MLLDIVLLLINGCVVFGEVCDLFVLEILFVEFGVGMKLFFFCRVSVRVFIWVFRLVM